MVRAAFSARIGPPEVVERMGIKPALVPDFKALAGDPSDKIPGVKGCGPVSAAALLRTHGNLDNVVTGWDKEKADQILMFREVARMRPDVPVKIPVEPPNWATGAGALAKLGLAGLAERLVQLK